MKERETRDKGKQRVQVSDVSYDVFFALVLSFSFSFFLSFFLPLVCCVLCAYVNFLSLLLAHQLEFLYTDLAPVSLSPSLSLSSLLSVCSLFFPEHTPRLSECVLMTRAFSCWSSSSSFLFFLSFFASLRSSLSCFSLAFASAGLELSSLLRCVLCFPSLFLFCFSLRFSSSFSSYGGEMGSCLWFLFTTAITTTRGTGTGTGTGTGLVLCFVFFS